MGHRSVELCLHVLEMLMNISLLLTLNPKQDVQSATHLIYMGWPGAHFKLYERRECVFERRLKHFAMHQIIIQMKFSENMSKVAILDIYMCKGC